MRNYEINDWIALIGAVSFLCLCPLMVLYIWIQSELLWNIIKSDIVVTGFAILITKLYKMGKEEQ